VPNPRIKSEGMLRSETLWLAVFRWAARQAHPVPAAFERGAGLRRALVPGTSQLPLATGVVPPKDPPDT